MEKAAGKKRRFDLVGSDLSASSSVHIKTQRLEVVTLVNSGNSTCESFNSDNVLASCCSSDGSSEVVKERSKLIDLKAQEENEVTVKSFATSAGDSSNCRSIEIEADSIRLDSTAMAPESNSRRQLRMDNMPSEIELEEFFAAAEKNLQKQFIDKYNFDIVKDEPLEGRYEWVQIQLKP